MSKQPPPAPTASAVGPCPTLIQISRTPRHWKFTQHHRTTRPPPVRSGSTVFAEASTVSVFKIITLVGGILRVTRRKFAYTERK